MVPLIKLTMSGKLGLFLAALGVLLPAPSALFART